MELNVEPIEIVPSEEAPRRAGTAAVIVFSAAMLLGAFLMFFVEPMLAKMLLPKLGGSPGVWNTCMVFFQACLLAGYAYAHLISRRMTMRAQVIVHATVLLLPLIVLPIALPKLNPPGDANPIAWLLLVLAMMVGLPFVAISTGAPLLQKWFGRSGHPAAGDPYFLYAASNIGSIVALIAYPIVIEPMLRLEQQAKVWSVGYCLWAALTMICALMVWRRAPQVVRLNETLEEAAAPTKLQMLRWVALAFVPSSYLLGVTTFITTDIASVPLLWIVPLTIYLLSFTLVFARRKIFSHKSAVFALPVTMIAVVLFMLARPIQPVWLILSQHLLGLFVASMVCHGELARTRPPSRYLTQFYLMISIGGVLGGIFNALIAPKIFSRPLEYPLAIFLTCLLCPPRSLFRDKPAQPRRPMDGALDLLIPFAVGLLAWIGIVVRYLPSLAEMQSTHANITFFLLAPAILLCMSQAEKRTRFALGIGAMLVFFVFPPAFESRLLEVRRSFFGIYRVYTSQKESKFIELQHAHTVHGLQHADPKTRKPIRADEPLSYYSKVGPVGQVLGAIDMGRARIGVVGLGTGTLAAYGVPGTRMTFFEIDPLMRWLAEDSGDFSYVQSARQRGAEIRIVLGDARLTLGRVPDESFDVMLLDAFSGDAIPIHLLTREALQLYLQKLSPHGVLTIHISNRYLDLRPILAALAKDLGCVCVVRRDQFDEQRINEEGFYPSEWLVIARSREDLGALAADEKWTTPRPAAGNVWTDDYSNLLSALAWRAKPE